MYGIDVIRDMTFHDGKLFIIGDTPTDRIGYHDHYVNIYTISAGSTSNSHDITALESRVVALETKATSNETTLNTIQTTLNNINATIIGIIDRLTTLETSTPTPHQNQRQLSELGAKYTTIPTITTHLMQKNQGFQIELFYSST